MSNVNNLPPINNFFSQNSISYFTFHVKYKSSFLCQEQKIVTSKKGAVFKKRMSVSFFDLLLCFYFKSSLGPI